jgi:hypothetical protein
LSKREPIIAERQVHISEENIDGTSSVEDGQGLRRIGHFDHPKAGFLQKLRHEQPDERFVFD